MMFACARSLSLGSKLTLAADICLRQSRNPCRRFSALTHQTACVNHVNGYDVSLHSSHLNSSNFRDYSSQMSTLGSLQLRAGYVYNQSKESQFSTSSFRQAARQNEQGTLIYEGSINSMVKGIKALSLSTSFVGAVVVPLTVINHGDSMFNLIIAAFCGFTMLTPVMIHWFAKGYVAHMYFNRQTDTYTAWTYTFFLTRKMLQFTPDDVTVPAVRNVLTAFTAKGVPLLVDEARLNHSDLYHLKGYDKKEGKMSFEDLKKIYGEEADGKKQ